MLTEQKTYSGLIRVYFVLLVTEHKQKPVKSVMFLKSSLVVFSVLGTLNGKSPKKGLCIPPGENFHCGDLAAFNNVRLGFICL